MTPIRFAAAAALTVSGLLSTECAAQAPGTPSPGTLLPGTPSPGTLSPGTLSPELWQTLNLDGGPAPSDTWTLQGEAKDVIACSGGPTGFLASRAHYRTLELEFEWRWPDKPGNSGLLLFTEVLGFNSLEGRIGGWPRNLEVQLQSGDAGHFVTLGPGVELDVLDPATGEVHRGDRIQRIFRRRAVDDVEKPLGQWNKMRVEVGLAEIVVYVNGVEVNRGVGGSLTAGHPGAFRPGPFAFQSEGAPIEFRNVKATGSPVSAPRALLDPALNLGLGSEIPGWSEVYRKPKEALDGPFAMVKNGTLEVRGQPGGYLQTANALGPRYQLSLEWAWGKERAGNSGVLLHVTKPDVLFGWPQSMEVQLQSGSAGDFWVIGEDAVDVKVPNMDQRRAAKKDGDLHSHRRIRRLPFEKSPERPLGQWNRMDIDMLDGAIRVYVNGQLVNEGTGLTVRAGALALQSEGTRVRFRNIFLR